MIHILMFINLMSFTRVAKRSRIGLWTKHNSEKKPKVEFKGRRCSVIFRLSVPMFHLGSKPSATVVTRIKLFYGKGLNSGRMSVLVILAGNLANDTLVIVEYFFPEKFYYFLAKW